MDTALHMCSAQPAGAKVVVVIWREGITNGLWKHFILETLISLVRCLYLGLNESLTQYGVTGEHLEITALSLNVWTKLRNCRNHQQFHGAHTYRVIEYMWYYKTFTKKKDDIITSLRKCSSEQMLTLTYTPKHAPIVLRQCSLSFLKSHLHVQFVVSKS